MACRYMLTELKNLSWQRLRSLLGEINKPRAKSSFMGNLIDLIRYAYKETSNEPGCTEPLRQLVTTYAAIYCDLFGGPMVDDLMMSTELSDREFVSDFTRKAVQRVDLLEIRNSFLTRELRLKEVKVQRLEEQTVVEDLKEEKRKNHDLLRKLSLLRKGIT
ncbi:MAG: hypothetical protein Q9198_008432 [Flavoplaca austrocitrina]